MLVYCSHCVYNLFIRAGNRGRWPASVKLVTLAVGKRLGNQRSDPFSHPLPKSPTVVYYFCMQISKIVTNTTGE